MVWDSNILQFLHLEAMVKIVKKWERKKKHGPIYLLWKEIHDCIQAISFPKYMVTH